MPVLLVEKGPSKGTKVKLKVDSEVIVGTGAGSSLILKDPLIAPQQLAITGADGAWWISDIGETDSIVFINGEQLEEETALRPGDQIEVGETLLSFSADAESKRMADPLVGSKVGGYEIIERVGRGGMGVVYKAVQLSLNREVALKLLAKKYVQDKNFINMFVEEARSAASMNHPNIVQAYDVGKAGDSYYFSMEYMAGGSIQDILAQEGKVDPGAALAMLIGAAKGLEFAEKKNIVHCDIKPDNLMLTDEGIVKIGDLGLSKNLGKEPSEGDSQIFGTPHFVAPEQIQGRPLDHRTDLYSLGASFFRIIAGRTPFTGETARELVVKHLKEAPPSMLSLDPDLPQEIDDLIQKLMQKDPSDRYQSAGDLVGDIRKAMIAVGADGGYTDLIPGIAGGGKKSKTGLIVGVLVAVVALIVAIVIAASSGPVEKTAEEIQAEKDAAQAILDREAKAGATVEAAKAWGDIQDLRAKLKDDGHPELEKECQAFIAEFAKSTLAPRAQTLLDAMPALRASKAKGAVTKEFAPLKRGLKSTKYDDPAYAKKLEDFIKKYPKSKEAKDAKAWLDKGKAHRASIAKHEADATAAYDPIKAAVAKLVAGDRWGEALTKVAAFDLKQWQGTAAAGAAAGLKAQTERAAGQRFLVLSGDAKKKEAAGDLDGAIAGWQFIVDRWGLKASVELASKEIARIKSKQADLAAQAYAAKISDEMQILRGVDQKCATDRAELKFDDVRKRYVQLRDDQRIKTTEVQKELDGRIRDFTHATLAMTSLVNACIAKAKKADIKLPEARWKGREARIEGADDEKVSVSYVQRMRLQTKVNWVDFTSAELLAVCQDLLPGGGQSNIHRGVLALLWGLGGDAKSEFETARRDPSAKGDADYYLLRLKSGGVVDVKAEEAAGQLRAKALALIFQADQTKDSKAAIQLYRDAEALLQQLKSKYPRTKAATGK